jgi:hypothetical protein
LLPLQQRIYVALIENKTSFIHSFALSLPKVLNFIEDERERKQQNCSQTGPYGSRHTRFLPYGKSRKTACDVIDVLRR